MGAIRIHHTKTDTNAGWDGPQAVADAPNEENVLTYMHAWKDGGGDPKAKSSYKFPHHLPRLDAAANINGVNNALARLSQANIPADDRAGVEAHLRAHRKDAGLSEAMSEAELAEALALPVKAVPPVLFSLPVTAKLDLPPRAELLPGIESGVVDHIDFTAKVFGTGRNRNPYLFQEADLPSFAASFEGQPYLRDHATGELDSRDGTIMDSRLDGGAFVQEIRLTTRRGMTDFIEGKMDRFSIGWFYDDAICSICNTSFFSATCPHRPGMKYQTAGGEKTCMLTFIHPQGRETSAVNSPAVENTEVIDARLQEFKLSLLEETPGSDPDPEPIHSEDSQTAEQTISEDGQAAGEEAGTAEASTTHVVEVADGGLTPPQLKAQVRQASLARQAEISAIFIPQGVMIMNIRELMAAHAAKITRARELATLADSESRDFTDEERSEYQACLAEAKIQGEKITQIQSEREQLQDAETLQAKLAAKVVAEKPAPGIGPKTMKRSDYNKLEALDQTAFIKGGGKVED
jgi:hypothetical protein